MFKRSSKILAAAIVALGAATTAAAAQDRDYEYYGSDCHRDNAAAGTVAGAIVGGIIGNQFGHGGGKAAATVGGVILGGAAGNAIGGDIDCSDRPYAYGAYRRGFDGRIGMRYDWDHGNAHGYIQPVRQYRWRGQVCRDFVEVSFRHGREYRRHGTACRNRRGVWRVR